MTNKEAPQCCPLQHKGVDKLATKETAIVPVAKYAALATSPQEMLAVIQENIGNDRITDRDLDRITLPGQGAINWNIPTLDGEQSMPHIDGIIVHWTMPRAYWEKNLDEGDGAAPPDCSSEDGNIGVGDPGGVCADCQFNQWGSAAKGTGKACKEKRLLFFLREGDLLPIVIQAPATSIRPIKQYLIRLASSGVHYWAVQTRLSLEKVPGAFPYSRIVPRSMGTIPAEDLEKVKDYVFNIKPLVDRAQTIVQDQD